LNLLLLLFLSAGCEKGPADDGIPVPEDSEPGQERQVLFSAPFTSQPDGFSFRNYGYGYPEGDLSILEVRELFGDAVCASIDSGVCIPTPAAQLWIDTMNGYMSAGHCAGFTVLSYRLFSDQLDQALFTSGAATTYDVLQEVPILRAIAKDYVYQLLEEVWSRTVTGSPRHIVDELIDLAQPVDLGIFGPDNAGHSMVAYAVEQVGEDLYWIRVYDSNLPGMDTYVEVDYAGNTWRYSLNGLPPAEDPEAWSGEADSNPLLFIPLSAYDQEVACPFCTGEGTASLGARRASLDSLFLPARVYVTIDAYGDLMVTDPTGLRLGSEGDHRVTDIPGSSLIPVRGALYSPFLAASFPQPGLDSAPGTFSMSFSGPSAHAASADWRVLGQGFGFSVENLDLSLGLADQFTFVPDVHAYQMSYTPGEAQMPILKMYYQVGEETYLVEVGDLDLLPGNRIEFIIDDTGLISISGEGWMDDGISLFIVHFSPAGIEVFATSELYLPGNTVLGVSFSMWTEGGSVDFLLDKNGDGSYETYSFPLNESPAWLLENLSVAEIITMLTDLAPYMSSSDTLELISHLSSGSYTPGEVGTILYAFIANGLSVDPELFASLITWLDPTAEELAELLFNLNLSEADLTALLETLDLSAEDLDILTTRLDALEVQEAEWLEELFSDQGGVISYPPTPGAPTDPASTPTPTFPPLPSLTFPGGFPTTLPTGFPTTLP
jgi:hypothetical protein